MLLFDAYIIIYLEYSQGEANTWIWCRDPN